MFQVPGLTEYTQIVYILTRSITKIATCCSFCLTTCTAQPEIVAVVAERTLRQRNEDTHAPDAPLKVKSVLKKTLHNQKSTLFKGVKEKNRPHSSFCPPSM